MECIYLEEIFSCEVLKYLGDCMADKKHNILIVTENLKVGGAEKYTVLVANELFRRGHKVVVLANDGPFRKHFDPGIRFVRVFFEHGILGVLYGAFQMVRVSLQERITFIHAQKLESSQAAWFARFITGVPVVKTAHGYTSKELITLGKLINKYSNKIVTVDDWLFGELGKNGIEADKLSVIYNGTIGLESSISAEEALKLRNDLGINQDDKVIVSTSRLVKGKNHPALLDWFKVINQQLPNTKLVLVGGGPEKDNLMKKTSELDLNNAVIFVDAITDTTKYLQISDIFVPLASDEVCRCLKQWQPDCL